ncbi:uncharacterized protein LOC133312236 [Gastrolobium bilobum]|uniref:uncharacterized protein LOC133312236 n=1 Tax=Gastrolobium bilobum TaxID=150636 RepID=UPI002AB14E32|nr:uncharacterized protein LOC133312236 [Gastrolobium bilobum]
MAIPLPDHHTNLSNPFFLHSNESPALVLKPDANDPTFPAWERCNTIVLAWIHRSINSSIARSILWIDQAKDAWRNLKARFSHSDIFKISDLHEEMYLMQEGDKSVTDYFTDLKIMWDELYNLRPSPSCSCTVHYSCNGYRLMREYKEQDCIVRFLKDLNEQYAHVRSQVMMINPMPDINRVFSLVVQQERHIQCESSLNQLTVNPKVFLSTVDNVQRGNYMQGRGRGSSNIFGRGR